MGYKNFGAETLMAADVNNYLMRQVVARVTTAERDAIAAPEPGMLIYNTDKNAFQNATDTGAWYTIFGGTWTALTYASGWAGYKAETPVMYRVVDGWCELRGIANYTAGTLTTSYVTLATGAPPALITEGNSPGPICAAYPLPRYAILNPRSDGAIRVLASTASTALVSLEGARYRTSATE